MPFKKQRWIVKTPIKATKFLTHALKINQKNAQRLIDKGDVFLNGCVFKQKGVTYKV